MAFDMKEAMAAALTLGMVVMFLNVLSNSPLTSTNTTTTTTATTISKGNVSNELNRDERSERELTTATNLINPNLWGRPGPTLEPCWSRHIERRTARTWGYIFIALSDGPHYHLPQVAEAVVVARVLGATLLLPIISGVENEPNSNFDNIYDVTAFIASLDGVVRVVGRLPDEARSFPPAIVKVPYKVSVDYIETNIRPVLKTHMVVQLVVSFPGLGLKSKDDPNAELEATRCLVIYGALKFHSQVQKIGDHILSRVREADELTGGRVVAMDIRADLLDQEGNERSTKKNKAKKSVDVEEVASFLEMLGFPSDTAFYLTQSRWDKRLNPLKEKFPNVHTKEYSMPFNEEKQILYSGNSQFEKAIDFYVCSHSDIFVPAIPGMFYLIVSGKRITAGRTQILVPRANKEDKPVSLKFSSVLSRYVRKKDHPVYFCFCKGSNDSE